jgi:2-phosphosulfolactate phosphatase
MGISLLDLVTEHQSGEENSLKRIVEKSGKKYDVSDAKSPVELDDGIYLWERKEDILEDMPEATYIIIDTMYFSSTVIELFSRGLETMSLHRTHEEVRNQENVDLKIGEGRNRDRMKNGMQMVNSPSFAAEHYAGEKSAAMMSNNGANATLNVIEGTENARILVGSTTNASAVAEKVQDDKDVHLVSSGADGVHRAEDHIAAYIISQEIQHELDESEHEMLKKMIDITGELEYENGVPERRRKDIEILKKINERKAIPEYDREEQVLKLPR